jgi:hypothetical protein
MRVLEKRHTVEELNELFRPDFEEGILYSKKDGRAILNKPNADGYLRVGIKEKKTGKYRTYCIHEVIYYMRHGTLPEQIDHKNLIKTDNRTDNLQPSNYNLQQVNMPKKQGTTSLYKGVCYYPNKASKKWRASLCHKGKHKSYGYYETQKEAALAYDRAAYDTWGEYAVPQLNFPENEDNYKNRPLNQTEMFSLDQFNE